MSPRARVSPGLLAQLSRAIGPESAQAEFRWMKQTIAAPHPRIPTSAKSLPEMVARRVAGEPLQYILGSQPFGPLELAVRPPVLIPREETEDWTVRLAETLRPSTTSPVTLLDLCTGSGCIPLLLCHLWPPGSVVATGVDINPAAVQLAKENAFLCGTASPLENPPEEHAPVSQTKRPDRPDRIDTGEQGVEGTDTAKLDYRIRSPPRSPSNTFDAVVADLMQDEFITAARLRPPYDVVTANPPYIPMAEYAGLPASVREHEDVRALVGNLSDTSGVGLEMPEEDRAKGLAFYHRIAILVGSHGLLRRGGTLALEVGEGQASAVAAIVEHKARLGRIDVWKDPWGKERVVVARK